MKKYIKLFSVIVCLVIVSFTVSGCSLASVSIYVVSPPKKIVYELNEKIDLSGLAIEGLNSDGTDRKIGVNESNIENEIDMTTYGEKTVIITVGELSTSFKIYIPHKRLNPESNIKDEIVSSSNGDIIYLQEGDYKATSQEDEKYYNIIVNKSLTFIGEKGKTNFGGNFLVGVNKVGEEYQKISDFKDVTFLNINFVLDYTEKDNFIVYNSPQKNTDLNGAIKGFDTNNLTVKNCTFKGYAYGINCDNVKGLSVIRNTFSDLRLSAINITENAETTSIYKNIFMDIAEDTGYVKDDAQGFVGAIVMNFNQERNVGVIISNNTFTRIALKSGDWVYYNEQAKEYNKTNKLEDGSYIKNSAIIILKSSDKENLEVSGIILSFNSFGNTLNNLLFGTTTTDFINHNAVIINNN